VLLVLLELQILEAEAVVQVVITLPHLVKVLVALVGQVLLLFLTQHLTDPLLLQALIVYLHQVVITFIHLLVLEPLLSKINHDTSQ
jgi:hypothetical protein